MPIGIDTHAWRRNLPHLQRLGRQYYITFVTKKRTELCDEARTIVLDTIIAGHLKSYALYSAVVMPDHVHLILTLYPEWTLPRVMKFIKGVSSRTIGRGNLWQREYFDRIIRHDEDLREKGEYIVANPVRAGLVERVEDYPWIWREWVEGRTAPVGTPALQSDPQLVRVLKDGKGAGGDTGAPK